MNNFDFCKEVVSSNPSIAGAKIIQNGELVAIYTRPNTLVPSPERFGKLLLQINIIWSMIKSNEDFFGKNNSFGIYSEKSDMLFFPIKGVDLIRKKKSNGSDNGSSNYAILALQVLSPYDHEKLNQSILDKIRKVFFTYSSTSYVGF